MLGKNTTVISLYIDDCEINYFGTSAQYISSLEKNKIYPKIHSNYKSLKSILSTGSTLTDDNYDGIIPLNELSWLKKPPHPSKITNLNDEIEVLVLDIDDEKKRINCSLKKVKDNPWTKLNESFNINDTFETEIVNIVDFGIFVRVIEEIDGIKIGTHKGIANYTVGQRKGIGVGGQEKPLYVKEVNKDQNYIVLAEYENLQKNKIFFKNINFLDNEIKNQDLECSAKIRSTQNEISGKLTITDNSGYFLFDEVISTTSPGQACVFYKNEQVLGGGWIT